MKMVSLPWGVYGWSVSRTCCHPSRTWKPHIWSSNENEVVICLEVIYLWINFLFFTSEEWVYWWSASLLCTVPKKRTFREKNSNYVRKVAAMGSAQLNWTVMGGSGRYLALVLVWAKSCIFGWIRFGSLCLWGYCAQMETRAVAKGTPTAAHLEV